jgi:hypothetical protein
MVNNREQAQMSKFYFKQVIGAFDGSRKKPDFLELKAINRVSYATVPGYGPGYVNTSAEIVTHYSAKITRPLTKAEEQELKSFMWDAKKFDDRAAMVLNIKEVKATAREYIRREQDAWKREGRIS